MPNVRRRVVLPALLAVTLAISLSGTASAAVWSDSLALGAWGTDPVELVQLEGKRLVAAFTNYAGRLVLRRSTDGGQTWRQGVRIGPSDDDFHAFAVAGDGNAVDAVWQVELPVQRDGHQARQRVWYARSTDGARTFADPLPLTPKSAFAVSPDVARDADGRVVVAWLERSAPYGESGTIALRSRVSSDGGSSFGPIQTLDVGPSTGAVGIWPEVTIDGGVIYVAYGVDGGKLRLRRSIDGGASWQGRIAIAEHAQSSRPAISVHETDVYVAYGTKTGAVGFRRSLDGGLSWSDFRRLSNGDGWSPTVSVTDGHVDAAFIREGSDWWDFDLVYRHSVDGQNWGPLERVRFGGRSPSLVRLGNRTLLMYGSWNGGDVGRVWRAEVTTRSD